MNACVILTRDADGVRYIAPEKGPPALEFPNRDEAIEWALKNMPGNVDWQLVELDEL